MDLVDIRRAIAAERRELADLLDTLTAKQWDAPSLVAYGRRLPTGRLHGEPRARFVAA
ncbi:hypothetical protein AB0M05_46715 [Streptomyces violaceusniger]|uniref:hypothetical protein n=1 Tax=Streptomyces violaceusniger TaxID=68280 RepID=UPI0034292810